jgi:chromosome transmission fidelity protein 8
MPTTLLYPPSRTSLPRESAADVLPPILQTPSGLALIELQGKIVLDDNGSDGTSDPTSMLELGRFVFPSADDTTDLHSLDDWDGRRVFLFVGKHQRLTGEVRKLNKPLAIIRRRGTTESSSLVTHKGQAQSNTSAITSSEELEIVEIITQKIMFSHRPEPIGVDMGSEVESGGV